MGLRRSFMQHWNLTVHTRGNPISWGLKNTDTGV